MKNIGRKVSNSIFLITCLLTVTAILSACSGQWSSNRGATSTSPTGYTGLPSQTPAEASSVQNNSANNTPANTFQSTGQIYQAAYQFVSSTSQGKASIVSVLPNQLDGMTAVVVNYNGAKQVGWLSPNGKAFFVGQAFGTNNSDISKNILVTHGFYKSPLEVYKKLLNVGHFIKAGFKGPEVMVFMDPNCIFCHLLYKNLQQPLKDGKIQVVYVMVGMIKPDILAKSTGILSSPNPLEALNYDETHFNKTLEEGGAKPSSNAKYSQVVSNNTELFKAIGATGTPTLLYCTKGNKEMQMISGAPSDLTQFSSQLDNSCKQ